MWALAVGNIGIDQFGREVHADIVVLDASGPGQRTITQTIVQNQQDLRPTSDSQKCRESRQTNLTISQRVDTYLV